MPNLPLSLTVTANERTRPIIEGSVRPEGIDLTVTVLDPAEMFFRQLKYAEFDVSEMSLSSLLKLAARGDSPWLALPVFTMRQFFHANVLVRADAGIERPADLKGKRVGVPEYQQTAALWVRAVLEHEFGVLPSDLDWYMERTPEQSHGGATGFQPPPGVRFQYIPPPASIASLLVAGELDATAFYVGGRTLLDRGDIDLRAHPRVRPLFPDPEAEGIRYYQKTGIFPINHGMVVRRRIVEQHPWVPLNLYRAFVQAKEQAEGRARAVLDPWAQTGLLPRAGLGRDPYPYGVQANRVVLETIVRSSHEQGLTPRVVALEEMFAPSTLAV